MWKEILKGPTASARVSRKIIEKSVKSLIDEYIKEKTEFKMYDFKEFLENNIRERVQNDGELSNHIGKPNTNQIVTPYLKNLDNYVSGKWSRYLRMQGFTLNKNTKIWLSNEISKAKLPAVKTEKYQLYTVFIKKILKKEGGAAGMKNFLEEGRKMKGFDERFLNYVIDDAIDNDNWLAEHEHGDYYLKE